MLGKQRIAQLQRQTYSASTNGVVNIGTGAGTTSIAYLFHLSSNTKAIEIHRILVSFVGGSGGLFSIRGAFITAENVTPGGTSQQIRPHALSLSPSDLIFRSGANAPTRLTGDLITYLSDPQGSSLFDWQIGVDAAHPIILRPGMNEGFEVRTVIESTLSVAANVAVSYEWTESDFNN